MRRVGERRHHPLLDLVTRRNGLSSTPDLGQAGGFRPGGGGASVAAAAAYLVRWSRPRVPVAASAGLVPGASCPRACCPRLAAGGCCAGWAAMARGLGLPAFIRPVLAQSLVWDPGRLWPGGLIGTDDFHVAVSVSCFSARGGRFSKSHSRPWPLLVTTTSKDVVSSSEALLPGHPPQVIRPPCRCSVLPSLVSSSVVFI